MELPLELLKLQLIGEANEDLLLLVLVYVLIEAELEYDHVEAKLKNEYAELGLVNYDALVEESKVFLF